VPEREILLRLERMEVPARWVLMVKDGRMEAVKSRLVRACGKAEEQI